MVPNRISLAPPFPGLRQFKQGHNFNQWTGDDSKALMKVSRCGFPHIIALTFPGVHYRT